MCPERSEITPGSGQRLETRKSLSNRDRSWRVSQQSAILSRDHRTGSSWILMSRSGYWGSVGVYSGGGYRRLAVVCFWISKNGTAPVEYGKMAATSRSISRCFSRQNNIAPKSLRLSLSIRSVFSYRLATRGHSPSLPGSIRSQSGRNMPRTDERGRREPNGRETRSWGAVCVEAIGTQPNGAGTARRRAEKCRILSAEMSRKKPSGAEKSRKVPSRAEKKRRQQYHL
ncbi:hypothetical protein LSH36_365g02023 [Paralvinella palmiformis]|uniref:Uncharacterized protein n=1 Tax=Paralvinella palmiformis TaxID=53620 RepID=A0AAD9JEY3_9ANNE|nr:hypothetical protein LSH36_365g02023 [Paralvinella palmiformis]